MSAPCQRGDHDTALSHYDRALRLAQDAADTDAEGMVLLGKGFALLSIGRAEDAVDALVACKRLSAANPAQECFVADLLAKAQGAARPQREEHTREGPEEREQPAAEIDAKASAPGESRKNPFEDVVRRAFVRSVVVKERIVLVMEGSPSAAATEEQHVIAQTLQRLRVRFHFIDTSNDADLARAFVEEWTGGSTGREMPCLPLLFVCGNLIGGPERLRQLQEQGEPQFASVIQAALPPHLSEQVRADIFGARAVAPSAWVSPQKRRHECNRNHTDDTDDNAHDGKEHTEHCKTQHTDRLRRLVAFVASKVVGGQGRIWDAASDNYPKDEEAVDAFLAAKSPATPDIGQRFLSELSVTLGGLELPTDLLHSQRRPHATVADMVGYIEEVCPAQGDCSSCPTRATCSAHDLAQPHQSVAPEAKPLDW